MIVLDTESTGLNPLTDSILSIGAIDLNDPTNQFYDECRIWDGGYFIYDLGFQPHPFEGQPFVYFRCSVLFCLDIFSIKV